MTVPVQTEPSFTPGTPEVLFEGDYVLEVGGRSYDVAPDGQRFLIIKEGGGDDDTSAQPQSHRRPELVRGTAAAGADELTDSRGEA